MPVAQAPTTLNSMTHYALTETQGEVLEGDGSELRKALRETASEEVKSRFQAAVDAGLIGIVDNTLPEPEPPPDGGEGTHQWVISDGGDPPMYWQDGSQEWVEDAMAATHYNDAGKDAEQLPPDAPNAAWVEL